CPPIGGHRTGGRSRVRPDNEAAPRPSDRRDAAPPPADNRQRAGSKNRSLQAPEPVSPIAPPGKTVLSGSARRTPQPASPPPSAHLRGPPHAGRPRQGSP